MPTIPRVNDHPEVAAAQAKLRALGAALEAAETRLNAAKDLAFRQVRRNPQNRYGQPVADPVESAIERAHRASVDAVLDGRPMLPPPPTLGEIEGLEWNAGVLRAAFYEQDMLVGELQGRVAFEILENFTSKHAALMRDAVEKLEAAADAIDALADLESALQKERLGRHSAWPHLGSLPRAIGSRRKWESPISKVARDCAAHIGRTS